ncbi:MAG: DNA mismatch repair endonuclease MutL [Oscillospiraceae bacterium]
MAIHILDQHTAELIAAGEVVERPASVVKELAENAIDAGATSVLIEIQRGGISLIRIQDDGTGIDPEDIPLAFLRHATSKVRTQEDLESISTLGFRGEALASIASVAQVQLLTKTQAAEFASLYHIEGGQEKELAAAARPVGTTIEVKNLFYNTPARMKFLKKDTSEGSFVTETVTRLALSHPEIAFRYIRDGKQIFSTPGDGRLQSAAYAVLGADFARELLPVENAGAKQYTVQGLVTPPRGARASRSMQFFYINGRFVKNRTMMAAMEQAYRGMLMQGRFPGGILFLQMPPSLVDVNVHPAKTEVRFAHENDVFDAVYSSVKGTLLANIDQHSTLQLTSPAAAKPDAPEGPAAEQQSFPAYTTGHTVPPPERNPHQAPGPAPVREYNRMVETLASESRFAPYETSTPAAKPGPAMWPSNGEAALTIEASQQTPERQPQAGEPVSAAGPHSHTVPEEAVKKFNLTHENADQQEPLRLIGEVFKTFILAQRGETLCVIDKHAAHERILYEKLVEKKEGAAVQQLLAPVTITLSAAEKNALLQNEQALAAAGLEIEDFGGNGILVRGVPADVEPDSVPDLALEIAGRLMLNSKDTVNEKTEWVLHSVACRAAVKAGDYNNAAELLRLAQEILLGNVPPFCPHGRPVVLEITHKELEKQFGRLG